MVTPPSCLKVMGGGVGWVALEILVSAQGPLFLGFGAKGLGPGLDNTNTNKIDTATKEKCWTVP